MVRDIGLMVDSSTYGKHEEGWTVWLTSSLLLESLYFVSIFWWPVTDSGKRHFSAFKS